MTRWGLILLVTFLVLGLRAIDDRRAVRYAVWLTASVLTFVFVKGHAL
jgi:hypothetical protein